MRSPTVWARVLGVEDTVVEGVELEEGGALIVAVRPRWEERDRCGVCRRRCPRYDGGEGRRRWRTLDLGATRAYLEAPAPRLRCAEHGVVVARVPWARHDSSFTASFEDQAAWLATHCAKSAVAELLRVAWRSVGAIVQRVVAEARTRCDPFAGLARIGIDEISYRRGARYLVVVVDHDSAGWSGRHRDGTARRCGASSTRSERSAAARSRW